MQLSVRVRSELGKTVKSLRKQGLVPAELYGHGIDNVHLAVDAKEFRQVLKAAGENTVIDLLIGSDARKALIYNTNKHFLSGDIDHVDFYEVRMDEKIRARVPLEFTGEAPAVKGQGGILNRSMSEIEVEALPGNLPHSLAVNLSVLTEIGQSIYVKDLQVPAGVSLEVDPETVIVSVAEPMKEEAAPVPIDVSEVKVEGEEKKTEEGTAAAGGEAETK